MVTVLLEHIYFGIINISSCYAGITLGTSDVQYTRYEYIS